MKKHLIHIPVLDGLRGIAALMIMFFHFFQFTNYLDFPILKKLSVFGQTGVTLFFVLSGFLITRILLNTKNTENYFKMFYIRRSLRIFPLYYFFLLISYLIVPLFTGEQTPSINLQWFYWFYLQDFAITFNWPSSGPSHFWSLAVEEHFYLFWPFIIYFFNDKKIVNWILVIICTSILLRVILVINGFDVFYFTFTTMDALAIGSLLAFHEKRGTSNYLNIYRCGFILSFIGLIGIWYLVGGEGRVSIQIFKLLVIAIFYFAMLGLILAAKNNNILLTGLNSTPLRFSGRISYGLYVYHPLVFMVTQNFLKSGNFFFDIALAFTCTYMVSWASYSFFESRFLLLKNKFNYN